MNEAVCTSGEHRSQYLLEVALFQGFGLKDPRKGSWCHCARLFSHLPFTEQHDLRLFFLFLILILAKLTMRNSDQFKISMLHRASYLLEHMS